MNSVSTDLRVPRATVNQHACVHQIVQRRAELLPDAIALSCDLQEISYEELNGRANQLAYWLIEQGVGPNIPVALYLARSLDTVVAALAVLKAGGTYVPIDLAYPQKLVRFVLDDTKALVLLTQKSMVSSLPEHSAKVFSLDADWGRIITYSRANPETAVTEDDLAYISYVSGTSGGPNGVMVTHKNVVRLFSSTRQWFHFSFSDVWTMFHSYASDFAAWEIWGALMHGGRLVVVPYLTTRSAERFYELVAFEGVTVLSHTPSDFRDMIWAEASAAKRLPLRLRFVFLRGESLDCECLQPWFVLHGDEEPQIINMYGAAETTVHATYRRIRMTDLRHGLHSVIGIPLPDMQIHLLDENLKPVSAGMPGEIFVGGAGVAKGYLNRPELNSRRFIPDPVSETPGSILYRSGDIAEFLATGDLMYLGRTDDQIRLRGARIQLGEIEAALKDHPAVQDIAVVATDAGGSDKRIIAYVVPRPKVAPTMSDLTAHLSTRVPDYMIPVAFVFVSQLPASTNGKFQSTTLRS